ncbi:hypothetical protein BDF14DRAFT_1880170 [Spinellus fusiger]|nr:hypothetical protein BDF14DRAFT_1880170 [Spinellus fusiger]
MSVPFKPSLRSSAYTTIADNDTIPRPWSIHQANSRLPAHTLQASLVSDLSLQLEEKDHPIPLNDLTQRHSNNPYLVLSSPASTPLHHALKHKTYNYTHPLAAAPVEAWQEMKDYNLQANGLPTLDQVMRLHTLSPLTLSHFSTFLRRRDVHQNLNFLLELDTHDKLWRAHVNSVERKQGTHLAHTTTNGSDKQDNVSLSRHDLVQNATRIYRTFCSALDAAQPIHLPTDHRVALEELVEKHQRPEPIVFESARIHVFEILNVFYYPQFVETVLYTNIAIVSARLLLMVGVVFLTLGFFLEFALVFLDMGTRGTRWWGFVLFLIGWTGVIASVTEFGWWLAMLGKNELRFLVHTVVQDKSIRRMHQKRGCVLLVLSVGVAFLNTLVLAYIPAHRLTA